MNSVEKTAPTRSAKGDSIFVTLVITTCTYRKSRPVADHLHMGALAAAPAAEVGNNWFERLAKGETGPVRSLYIGRAYQVAAQAADALDARLLVVSAGLGLIDADSNVPPYACTVLVGERDSVAGRVQDGVTPSAWWRILQDASPFAISLADAVASNDGLTLASLSDAYLDMLSDELLALPPEQLARLRLFTRAPLSRVPLALQSFVMPYDDRLEGDDSNRSGTRDNFAARALRHFAETILSEDDTRSTAEHREAVLAAIGQWGWPKKVERRSATDEEIMALMEAHWETTRGVHSRLLTLLRNTLFVRCEQGRCKALADQVRATRI